MLEKQGGNVHNVIFHRGDISSPAMAVIWATVSSVPGAIAREAPLDSVGSKGTATGMLLLLLLPIFLVEGGTCSHHHSVYMCMSWCTHLWMPRVDRGCLPLLFSTLFFSEAVLFLNLEFTGWGRLAATEFSIPLYLLALRIKVQVPMSSFYMTLGIQTQVLAFAHQKLYILSHLFGQYVHFKVKPKKAGGVAQVYSIPSPAFHHTHPCMYILNRP